MRLLRFLWRKAKNICEQYVCSSLSWYSVTPSGGPQMGWWLWWLIIITHFPKEVDLCWAHVTHLLDHLLDHTSFSDYRVLSRTHSFSCWRTARPLRGSMCEGHADPSHKEPDRSLPKLWPKIVPVPWKEVQWRLRWKHQVGASLWENAWQLLLSLPYLECLPAEH